MGDWSIVGRVCYSRAGFRRGIQLPEDSIGLLPLSMEHVADVSPLVDWHQAFGGADFGRRQCNCGFSRECNGVCLKFCCIDFVGTSLIRTCILIGFPPIEPRVSSPMPGYYMLLRKGSGSSSSRSSDSEEYAVSNVVGGGQLK